MDINHQLTEKIDKPLVLIGMMGSGKTHAGQILSHMLGFPFYDSDKLIVQENGMSIEEIFKNKGETAFRKMEADKILSLLDNRAMSIISTGGGAVINPTVLNAIKEYSYSIWLMVNIPTILKRLEHDMTRPLLLSAPDRAAKLEELLRVRRPLYAQADIKIECDDMDENTLQKRLYNALYEFINLR